MAPPRLPLSVDRKSVSCRSHSRDDAFGGDEDRVNRPHTTAPRANFAGLGLEEAHWSNLEAQHMFGYG